MATMNDRDKKRQASDWTVLGLTVALASILVPAVFPKQITVSPLVLFGIVYLSNVTLFLIPEDRTWSQDIWPAVFCTAAGFTVFRDAADLDCDGRARPLNVGRAGVIRAPLFKR
jgi:hypothetical protein